MRRHTHLLLAKSEVAGWGLFTKNGLKKGDYVHEVRSFGEWCLVSSCKSVASYLVLKLLVCRSILEK
jgi:hypothetical protein